MYWCIWAADSASDYNAQAMNVMAAMLLYNNRLCRLIYMHQTVSPISGIWGNTAITNYIMDDKSYCS